MNPLLSTLPFSESSWCVAVCCSVLQYVAACCRSAVFDQLGRVSAIDPGDLHCVAMCCRVLQCVAHMRLTLSMRFTMNALEIGVAVLYECYTMQCVAACCSVLQRVAAHERAKGHKSHEQRKYMKRPLYVNELLHRLSSILPFLNSLLCVFVHALLCMCLCAWVSMCVGACLYV